MERNAVMSHKQGKVVALCEQGSDEALERLNRLTGLRFARWPESLVAGTQQSTGEVAPVLLDAEPKPCKCIG